MRALLTRLPFKPYALLIPWVAVAGVLAATLAGVHLLLVGPAQDQLARLEAEWVTARRLVLQRQEAKQARKDLAHVLALLPARQEFVRFPLAISEMARRDRVALPTLSYTLEKPEEGLAVKAILQGPVTGRYEDIRRFIHHVEASDRLLFIEDLDVGRSGSSHQKADKKGEKVTVNLRIATYIREGPRPGPLPVARVE